MTTTIEVNLPTVSKQQAARTIRKTALIAAVGIVPYGIYRAGKAIYNAIMEDDTSETPAPAPAAAVNTDRPTAPRAAAE